MNAAALQQALEPVVVGHLDGHGRTLLWQGPGIGDQAEAIRQAAVLPAPLDVEPGWLLRRLPDRRVLFLAGGAHHPTLVDGHGRSGIFHAAGFVAAPEHVAVALCAPDATRLCVEVVRASMRGMGAAPALQKATLVADEQGPLQWRGDGPLPATDWPGAQAALRRHGLRPFVGPVGGKLVPVDGPLQTGSGSPLRLDAATPAAKRVLAAWS